MKRNALLLCTMVLSAVAFAQQTITVSVSNPMNVTRKDQPVVVSLARYGDVRSALVSVDGQETACQLDDLDQDDRFDELFFLADLGPRQTRTYNVVLSADGEPRKYSPRVFAEMLMRNDKVKEKNRHDNFIESITARGDCANSYNLQHHHGVAFESELNGIRIYFDQRQTLDLYGKFQHRLELEQTQFYTSDQQKKEDYGDDVLWVGQTFGLGAFRGWDGRQPTMIAPVRSRTQRIVSYGPLRTIVEIVDRGWQLPDNPMLASAKSKGTFAATRNLTLRYTQYAGHRDTQVDVVFDRSVADHRFSTGIINVKGSEEYSDHQGLRACWGTDYPSTDTVKWSRETVGLAICVPRANIASEQSAASDLSDVKDGRNYTYVIQMPANRMRYHVSYCSANEREGYHSAAEWFAYVKAWKRELAQPVSVLIK